MSKWDQVHKILDREVEREVRKVLGRIKAVVGGRGNGSGAIRVTAATRRAVKRAYHAKSPIVEKLAGPSKQRQLHGRYLGLIRTLPAAAKKECSALYKEKGVRAAIAEARKIRAAA